MPDQDEWDEIERAKALRDPHAVRRDRQHDPLRDEWLAILGDLPACRALWREQLEAIVEALLPSVRPRGEATLGDDPTKEEVAEYLRHHQTMPDHLVRPPRGEATDA